jgi:hypothetical protein
MSRFYVIGSILLVGACSKVDDGRVDQSSVDSATHVEPPTSDIEPDAHAHSAAGKGRALLPIMQELGVRMAALTHGIMVDSAQMVAENAELMAEHVIATEEIARLQRTLGSEMAEFERIDTEMHGRLLRLRDAAAAGRSTEVLTRLNEVQRGCVECHDRFRDRLRAGNANAPTRE